MMIEVNYVHFHNLNRNVLDLGKQVRELAEENTRLKAQVERLTKAGDKMSKELIRLEDRFNGIESAEAQMWYTAKEGGCP
jgi:hypothetical protein